MNEDEYLTSRYDIEHLECKRCHNQMRVYDVDYNFRGCMDIYDTCDNCNASAVRKIRYEKCCKIVWVSDDDK